MTPEEARVAGCLGAAVVAVAIALVVLYATGTWPFKKDAAPEPAPGAIAPAPAAGQPGQPGQPASGAANRIVATPTGLSFLPAFARAPAPGSRLAFVYRLTPAGGAPLDEAALRNVVIEARYETVAPPPNQHPSANVVLGLRRIPLRAIEDEPAGTVLEHSSFPHGTGIGAPGAPGGKDAGWLVVCASKFRDGVREGQAVAVDFPWKQTAAAEPRGADLDRMAITGGVAEFVPPKDGFAYRFSQFVTPVCRYPDR